MSVQSAGVMTILGRAIEMEREGKGFFEDVAAGSRHQRTKDTFMSLAKQEQRHMDILGEELRRLGQGENWASLQELRLLAPQPPNDSVFKDKKIKRMKLNLGAGELDALKLGIEIEKKSIDYYREAGLGTSDDKAREVFAWLVGEESGHLTILTAEYEYRTKSGFYYDNMEFSLEVM